jgi:aminopeptidase N
VPSGAGGFSSFSKSSHSGGNAIYTLSQPFGASDWWPCKNTLNDKADSLDIYITTPVGFTAVSNGILADTLAKDSLVTFHWRHRHPIATYLIAIAVTRYIYYRDTFILHSGRKVIQDNYIYPSSLNKALAETPVLGKSLLLFSDLFGDYPFTDEKYGHAQFGWGGGMEHQTISFVGNFSHDLLVHELAHQWFGDFITCGSWIDLWLNEGFATYLTGVSKEMTDTAQISFLQWKARTVDAVMAQPDGSIYNLDTFDINRLFDNRLTYNKAAMLLHMLRLTIGDMAFFNACRNYLTAHRNGFVRSEALIREMEAVSKKDLKYYFSQWLYGAGYPIYDLAWLNDQGQSVRISVQQRTSVNSVAFFKLPLPLRFYNGSSYWDTLIMNEYNGQVFQLNLPWKADSMAFNAGYDLVAEGHVTYLGGALVSDGNIILYPNNGSREVNFESRHGITVVQMELYSSDGKRIHYVDAVQPMLNGRCSFTGLPCGLYLLKFRFTGGTEETVKLLLD